MPEPPVRILVVESDPGEAERLLDDLSSAGSDWFVFSRATDVACALASDPRPRVHAVLLGPSVAAGSNEAIRDLADAFHSVAILAATREWDTAATIRLLRAGVDECFVKRTLAGAPLRNLIRAACERAKIVLRREDETLERHRRLESMLRTDELTGLCNLSHFMSRLEQEHVRSSRYRRPLALARIRVDRFEALQERHGPAFAEELLVVVAQAVEEGVRRIDVPARLKGPDFGILLVETPGQAARVPVERVRSALYATPLAAPGGEPLRITISGGVAGWSPGIGEAVRLLELATTAMERAIEAGGDRLISAEVVPDPPGTRGA